MAQPTQDGERYKAERHIATTTVTNESRLNIAELVVRDNIPSGDEGAGTKIVLRKPEGLVCAEDGDVAVELDGEVQVRWAPTENGPGGRQDGIFEWVCNVPAGKTMRLVAEWDVRRGRIEDERAGESRGWGRAMIDMINKIIPWFGP